MNRKDFLSKLGIGAAFVLTSTCLGSCTRDEAEQMSDINLELDLNDDRYTSLSTVGNYVIVDSVVVARTITGDFVAATSICSHEGLEQITYSNQNEWFCTAHGARFSIAGEGLNANGSKGLQIFQTELSGNILKVFS